MNESFIASVPSNIAFIKYWGKRPGAEQWPANDSLSMTLNQLQTKTCIKLSASQDHTLMMNDRLYTRADLTFAKTFAQLDRLAKLYDFHHPLAITTSNSFPMGAGIASSASGLAALTIACLAAWTHSKTWSELAAAGFSSSKLADLARLGSGSACRSLYSGYVLWQAGKNAGEQQFSSLFPAEYWPLRDTVVLFSQLPKSIGSTEAHTLAWSSPLFELRLNGLADRMQKIQAAIARRDLEELGTWLEIEALEMHTVIMTAQPPIHYLNSAAWDFLLALRKARQNNEIKAWFTIDAGPNIHLIHEQAEHARVYHWLTSRFNKDQLLHDSVGRGPHLDFQSE